MATAAIAVILIGGFLGTGWLIRRESLQIQLAIEKFRDHAETNFLIEHRFVVDTFDICTETRDVLKAASRLKASRADSPFEQPDKIPSTAPARDVPVARRRAAAEMQSAGTVTHDDQVRKNNERAMEKAG